MGGCKCENSTEYRATSENTGDDHLYLRCCGCGGKAGKVAIDVTDLTSTLPEPTDGETLTIKFESSDSPWSFAEESDTAQRYYDYHLGAIADRHGISQSPFDDDVALLKACLYARQAHPELVDKEPPERALRGLAEVVGIKTLGDSVEHLSESTADVATRMFHEFEPADVESAERQSKSSSSTR